ncbi:excinuclease ABC subunit UvrB [Mycoplasmopsis bovirhinis]|uniref:UvrABC system protein B n=1 Tax=Mycoplasmopsis bovirhinis TaxID=29553 RepID=A0A449AER4_9BACT|nr:excinuclease ABC subunit UvrB [Mycoplasmopsis bovirhinis]VEU63481.1 excinuclease ABC subunit B [Mycoplasmopsis bovirhinis]
MIYKLNSEFKPGGDQPKAIEFLTKGIKKNQEHQVLLGVTGSGKTFTIANIIQNFERPVLVLSHNKTLASQLYSELKGFFPENCVEYYISYFDYYRPEAYISSTDTYIEKDSKTNEQIEIMRMKTVNSLLTRKDVIVIASVSAIYGALNPAIYSQSFLNVYVEQEISIQDFARKLINIKYERNDVSDLSPGQFSVKGDIVIIRPADSETQAIQISFWGDFIEEISLVDSLTKETLKDLKVYILSPGDAYAAENSIYDQIIPKIQNELTEQLTYFTEKNKLLEKERLSQRVKNDINDLKEFRMCKGIENYSMYLDGRNFGQRPYTLLDYFPKDSLIFIDESHITVPQINAMISGDQSRKRSLVDFGFRLPSALENRPLSLKEFEDEFEFKKIYVSATPSNYELTKSNQQVFKMYVRPTGLVDPEIIIKPTKNQVEDIFLILEEQKQKNERTIILTTTKESSEKLSEYMQKRNVKAAYIHSEHTIFERNEIIRKLRIGAYDVIIGINLLREGVDIPEVSKVLILDADKGGFMRSETNLIQIVGRASRNVNGQAILYADTISEAMKKCILDNQEKRKIQIEYNLKNNIIPKSVSKKIPSALTDKNISSSVTKILKSKTKTKKSNKITVINELTKEMLKAASERDYVKAQEIKDLIFELESEGEINV